MNGTFRSAGMLTAALALAAGAGAAADRPNFLVIVADDLGYSDIAPFGGEIDTPALDQLANDGLRLTQFHTAATCSPTRSMLFSGTDNHRAGLGSMAELLAPNQKGQPGHEGYLRPEVASLAERLQAGGYRTVMSGKWHLGLKPEQDPHARGFDHSFALLPGAANHFGTDGAPYTEDGVRLTELPANFYSSDTYADKLIELLGKSTAEEGADKPFFAYLAFTAPHWPLQAHPEDIAKYSGRYAGGYEPLREQRLVRQEELGLLDPAVVPHIPTLPGGSWDSLTAEQQREEARDMEIYAAMVDRMDHDIGRVLDELRRTGEYDNTVILFFADNGAEGVGMGPTSMLADRVAAADNALDNRGAANSYVAYGPGWAQAATAPSWRYKAYATEGGTRTPAIIAGPGIAGPGIARQGIGTAFLSVQDVLPTLLDLAGLPADDTFEGRQVEPIRGHSWGPYLAGTADRVYGPNDAFGWELFGSRALRRGDWKITDLGDGQWRLFDLAKDPGETRDLSLAEPERATELAQAWEAYGEQVGVILPDSAAYRP
ncbi:MAG: arylsulfatase [Amaricoccus sp.]|uniref:arylsulfatase n=1 Tax=Amaricoccus sp. TaxID=1872485 RepID=UPI0039E2F4FF